jgi:hypothetical protein
VGDIRLCEHLAVVVGLIGMDDNRSAASQGVEEGLMVPGDEQAVGANAVLVEDPVDDRRSCDPAGEEEVVVEERGMDRGPEDEVDRRERLVEDSMESSALVRRENWDRAGCAK